MEMKKEDTFLDDLPPGDAIIGMEETDYGWRGLTAKGEIFEARSRNGHKAMMPDGDSLITVRNNVRHRSPISRTGLRIGDYVENFESALASTRQNQNATALSQIDAAMAQGPTLYARYNRALILLALGRWREGFAEYRECERHAPFMRPAVTEALGAGLKLWDGEDLAGKRLLLLHAHGLGDTIMTLRYVPLLRAVGANVTLKVPDALHFIAGQFATVTSQLQDADFFCPMVHVLDMLAVQPDRVTGDPYLSIAPGAVERTRDRLGPGPHIGLAWSTSAQRHGDYPRTIPLDQLVAALGTGAQLHSVQQQDGLDALKLGVRVHEIENFAACAALMLAMDRIITVDTAAVHLAGAIGHPRVDLLLSHWASWRWLAPWYAKVRLCRQTIADDWGSALQQLESV